LIHLKDYKKHLLLANIEERLMEKSRVWHVIFTYVFLAVIYSSVNAEQISYRPPTNSTGNNFTLLWFDGNLQDGSNDVLMSWDGTVFTSSDDYIGPGSTSNMTLSSDEPIAGGAWTAHDAQIFGPGMYEFDVTLGGGVPETGTMTLTVGENQLGAHILINFVGNNNIDIVLLWDMDNTFSTQDQDSSFPFCQKCLWSGADNGVVNRGGILDGTQNTAETVFNLVSVDGNGDGIPGIPMAPNGPFSGLYPNFSFQTPPPPVTPIIIDIKPGSDPNSINLGSAGVIPVAILSTADFDALTVNPASVSLAGASVKLVSKDEKYLCHQKDVNLDGLIDLVCQVYTAQFMVEAGETTAILEAETLDGTKLRGEDNIRLVPYD
jgi:hypothetical protein